MNIDEQMLDEVLAEMRTSVGDVISRRNNVFSTGFIMGSGRAVGVVVEPALTVFRVSDSGDAWRDLVMNGYTDPRPTFPERERLQRACEVHGTRWDVERREIFALAKTSHEIAECAGRVATAAIAIEGWKAWYPPRKTRDVNKRRIVDHLQRLAPIRGWSVERTEIVRGNVHTWAADATLARGKARAAVEIAGDRNAEHLMQRIVGFLYDVKDSGLVVVVSKRIDEQLQGSAELKERVAIVPRMAIGTPRAIVLAAERAAA